MVYTPNSTFLEAIRRVWTRVTGLLKRSPLESNVYGFEDKKSRYMHNKP